jgi:hypothetical protein
MCGQKEELRLNIRKTLLAKEANMTLGKPAIPNLPENVKHNWESLVAPCSRKSRGPR